MSELHYVDTHCHLMGEEFQEDLEEVIAHCKEKHVDTQQTRNGEAVHIRVNNAHRKPARGERGGKIRGHGGLAHAALA